MIMTPTGLRLSRPARPSVLKGLMVAAPISALLWIGVLQVVALIF